MSLTEEEDTQRTDYMRTQREGVSLHAKDRGPRRTQTCPHIDFGLPASQTKKKKNCCLSHPVDSILLWQA